MAQSTRIEGSDGAGRIKGLDGIRACAFLLVLGGHCGFKWIPNGFGVTVFFFLSGYLITTLLRREWLRSDAVSVRQFYIRRAFRILPPLYCGIVLAIVLALTGVIKSDLQWKAIAAIQLFLTNYSETLLGSAVPLGLSVLWSLAVEEHFYLVFPWLYRYLLRHRIQRSIQALILGCICIMALAWRSCLMFQYHTFWNRVYTGTDTRLDSILFGSIMAITANPVIDRVPGMTRSRCTWAAIMGIVVLVVSIAIRGELFRQTIRYTIQGIALFPIFFYVVRNEDSLATRTLEAGWLKHLGDLSYSLY